MLFSVVLAYRLIKMVRFYTLSPNYHSRQWSWLFLLRLSILWGRGITWFSLPCIQKIIYLQALLLFLFDLFGSMISYGSGHRQLFFRFSTDRERLLEISQSLILLVGINFHSYHSRCMSYLHKLPTAMILVTEMLAISETPMPLAIGDLTAYIIMDLPGVAPNMKLC